MALVHPFFAIIATIIAIITCALMGRFRSNDLSGGRYRSIDGLRGYLAFFVFLHHAIISYFFVMTGEWRVPPSNLFTHLGETSVLFFFMITAFLFYGKVLDTHDHAIDWPKFFVARLLRLGPLYVVAVAMLMALVVVESHGVLVDSIGYISRCVGRWFLFTFFGAPSINGIYAPHFLAGVNWSLPYEWYFYLSMPLLAVSGRTRVSGPYVLLSVAALVYAFTAGASVFFAAVFCGGIAAAFAARSKSFVQFAKTKTASILVITCLALLVINFPSAYGYVQLALIMASFSLIASGTNLFGALLARPSHILGELSYSIYLLHGLLLFVTLKYIVGYERVRDMSAIAYLCLICVLIPILLLVSTLAFRKVEFPCMQLTPSIMAWLRAQRQWLLIGPLHDPLADPVDHDGQRPVSRQAKAPFNRSER